MTPSCPLCGELAAQRFLLPYAAAWFCTSVHCRLGFALPQLDEETLERAYGQHYYPHPDDKEPVLFEQTPEGILQQLFQQATRLLGNLQGWRLLDYGCGKGSLCRLALQNGLQPTGIEADENGLREALCANSFPAYRSLEALLTVEPKATFDIVVLWNVIEHLRKPWVDLQALRSIVATGGHLLISTPNALSLRARVEGARWFNYQNPTHLYYFTRPSLRVLLQRCGFSRIQEWRFPFFYPHHGWLRQVLQQALRVCRIDGELLFAATRGS